MPRTASCWRKVFMPESRLVAECAVASTPGWPSYTITLQEAGKPRPHSVLLSTTRTGGGREEAHAPVGQVGGHDEVVLDHEGRLLRVHDEPLDHLGPHRHTSTRTVSRSASESRSNSWLLFNPLSPCCRLFAAPSRGRRTARRSGTRQPACPGRARWPHAAAHHPTAS